MVAQLATGWEITDDGRQVVLEIADDVTFHDGIELTAAVVVANIERWGSVKNILGSARLQQLGRLPFSVVFGGFLAEDTCLLESVEATDDYEVTLTLREPIDQLLTSLTHPSFSVTSPNSWPAFDEALKD